MPITIEIAARKIVQRHAERRGINRIEIIWYPNSVGNKYGLDFFDPIYNFSPIRILIHIKI